MITGGNNCFLYFFADKLSESILIKTTDYITGFIYENNVLQFFGHEEGRIRRKDDGAFVFDYMLKDHLGNVRMVLTEEQKIGSISGRQFCYQLK